MFVDSSALVAMIASEEDGERLSARLDDAYAPTTSPLVVFETVLALMRIQRAPMESMTLAVMEYLERAGVRLIAIDAESYLAALRAHEKFGKGTGHPARLNMGDCFSHAAASSAGVSLLYKGDDFALTDLA
jgi:ribonuclease VapC